MPVSTRAKDPADAVVIGAGISGLIAARRLADHGLHVVVLESRRRVGGRVHACSDGDGNRFDLGATWFWPGEQHVAALIDELAIQTHAHFLDGDAIYHAGNESTRLDGNPIDVPSGRFTDGASSITDALADRLPRGALHLGTPALAVEAPDQNALLRVEHAGGSFETRHAIIAIPPSLAVERIRFRPALPDPLHALATATPVWMGAIAKVVVRYPTPFWRDLGLSGSAISHQGPLRELHDMSGPGGRPAALFGFVPLTGQQPVPSSDQIRSQLTEIFGPTHPEPMEIVIADWCSDTDTSPPGVDRLDDYRTFGHERYQTPALDGRLHWASTETAPINPGHIDGAIVAGERAALNVISAHQPHPLEGAVP